MLKSSTFKRRRRHLFEYSCFGWFSRLCNKRKMRLMSILHRARRAQNENKVPFQEIVPLRLKDRVSSKTQKANERGCLYETSLLLSCLEEHGYEDKSCVQEMKTLDECYKKYVESTRRQHLEQEQVTPVPNSKNQTHKQITYLLRRYPTI